MAKEQPDRYIPALRFRCLTPAYDLIVRASTRERTFKNALVEQARLRQGHRVLDLGCGTGTLALLMAQRCSGAMITGVDADPAILSLAARKAARGAGIQFDRALASALPYADETFDRVVSSLFFHHLSWQDKERAAREAFRVLRQGGELHVADWGLATGPLMRTAFVVVQLLDGFANTRDNAQGCLPALFRQAGFREVSEARSFNTLFGTLTLYSGKKAR